MIKKAAKALARKLDLMLRKQAGANQGLMHYCAKLDQPGRLLAFNKLGFEYIVRDVSGLTPLHICAWNGCSKALNTIIKNADKSIIDMVDVDGSTALMFAVMKNNKQIVSDLIKAGARLDLKDKSGKMAIDYCTNEEIKLLFSSILSMQEKLEISKLLKEENKVVENNNEDKKRL